MAVMPLRTFPVARSRAPPSVGRRFFETARHDNRIKFARARNRHDRELDRVLQTRAGGRVECLRITWTSLGSDYRRYGWHTRRQRCFDWIRGRFNYRSSFELRPIMVAGGRLD